MTTQFVFARQALTNEGWQDDVLVAIDGDRIESVRASAKPAGHVVDILLPAPVNLHSHGFQRAMAGLSECRSASSTDSFWTWRQDMYRFLHKLEPTDVEAITAFAMMEMAEAGFGAVAEFHYLHHGGGGREYANIAEMSDRIAAAADKTGLGLTLLEVLYQYGGCGQAPPAEGQLRFVNDEDRFADLFDAAQRQVAHLPPDCRIGIAAHSLRAVDQTGLAFVEGLGQGMPVHIHLAEQKAEVDEVVTHYGALPGDWLLDHAEVDSRWCLIHCTQLRDHEIKRFAATGAVVGLCPITESSLGDGIFAGVQLRESGGHFGIGTDSNIRISLAEELRTLEYSQRLRDHARAVLATPGQSTGRALFDAVAAGGSRAARRDSGIIQGGLLADLVSFDGRSSDLDARSEDMILDAFVFCGDNTMVRDLWSAGRHIVRDGQHVARESITKAYRACTMRLSGKL